MVEAAGCQRTCASHFESSAAAASVAAGLGAKLRVAKTLVAVENTRNIGKKSLIHNGATPKITSRMITATQDIPTGNGGRMPVQAQVEIYQKAPNLVLKPDASPAALSRRPLGAG